jgi:hypothetical protein
MVLTQPAAQPLHSAARHPAWQQPPSAVICLPPFLFQKKIDGIEIFTYFAFQSTFNSIKMDKRQEQLEALTEIRSMMERSSRFLSLSGFTGVIAGLAALAGVVAAYQHLGLGLTDAGYYAYAASPDAAAVRATHTFLLADMLVVLLVALLGGTLLTMRKARRQGLPIWDGTARRMLINLVLPLAAGGIYCLALVYHGQIAFVASATLIFYGMALLNASKYTLNDIRYLGILEIITGLMAAAFIDYGLLFWAFGFGVLHIIYGLTMYFKYDQ